MKWLARDLIRGPYLGLALSEKQFRAALRHCQIPPADWPNWIKTDHADATTHFLENPRKHLVAVVCLRHRDDVDGVQIASLLVHEAVHVWQEFRARIGESEPSPEFEAYSIQAISQELMQAYADSIH